MTPGTVVKLPDGREGTVVYHGLDGYGIRWGRQKLSDHDMELILLGTADLHRIGVGRGQLGSAHLEPEAMLCMRCRWTGAIDAPFSGSDPSCPECAGVGAKE